MDLTQVLIAPLITEKSMQQVASGEYPFVVDKKATRRDIARAVEKCFKVSVRSVRTISISGKKRKVGRFRKVIKLPDWKKAIVRLAPEQRIDIFDVASEKKR